MKDILQATKLLPSISESELVQGLAGILSDWIFQVRLGLSQEAIFYHQVTAQVERIHTRLIHNTSVFLRFCPGKHIRPHCTGQTQRNVGHDSVLCVS